jgi:hypothetical protein
MLIAGPLSDVLLEPAMRNPESLLASTVGWAVGTGPGRGMALLFIIGGCLAALVGLTGYVFRVVRDVDTLLPDHDTLPEVIPHQERANKMQELLAQRSHWVTQPDTPEREAALKSISISLRKLGQGQLEATE